MPLPWLHFLTALLLLGANDVVVFVAGEDFTGDYSKLSGIIIPGFASTQLRAWSFLDCPFSPLDFNPLDLVWLDTTKVLCLNPISHFVSFSFNNKVFGYICQSEGAKILSSSFCLFLKKKSIFLFVCLFAASFCCQLLA